METRSRIDILSLFLYFSIAIIGIASVYSATYEDGSMTLLDGRSGKQIMWFGVSLFVGIIIFFLNANFFEVFSWYFYVPLMLLLVVVLFIGTDINGARSWIKIGSFSLQPSEFAKYGAAFAVSSVLSYIDFSFNKRYDVIKLFAVIAFPAILIVIQGDTGSALVFASFILVFYREGLTPLLLVLGIVAIFIFVLTLVIGFSYFAITTLVLFLVFNAFTYTNKKMLIPSLSIMAVVVLFSLSVQFLFNNVLQKHQQKRIQVTLNLIEDNQGAGYNVNQSKIAIGSGGFAGKGFLNGSHTKGNFIPEQTTDFIFCTIGEEGGWLLSTLTITLFMLFILRLLYLASRAKKKFKRIFILSLASIFFFHLLVNVGMTIGLMPVIGIPLPLISYGGSSILAFGIFIFTALKMDASRDEDLTSES
ncbi:rod shape-determining protein RodA [Bacteroidia bacterium]|nr:rod shape-determining protein RodA [Bacteroidia bacterium]|tara:strand:+ start:3945 stop:5198 length:1254 start_codon:yes stop_codon:yes gene_type:complete